MSDYRSRLLHKNLIKSITISLRFIYPTGGLGRRQIPPSERHDVMIGIYHDISDCDFCVL